MLKLFAERAPTLTVVLLIGCGGAPRTPEDVAGAVVPETLIIRMKYGENHRGEPHEIDSKVITRQLNIYWNAPTFTTIKKSKLSENDKYTLLYLRTYPYIISQTCKSLTLTQITEGKALGNAERKEGTPSERPDEIWTIDACGELRNVPATPLSR
jgi:hypothetical protein